MSEVITARRQQVLCKALKRAAEDLQRVPVDYVIADLQLQIVIHRLRNHVELMVFMVVKRRYNQVRVIAAGSCEERLVLCADYV